MLARQRQATILDLVRQRGGVRGSDLVREFGVSDMTVRRDLEALAERGLIAKVHGGATAAEPHATDEPGFAAKSARQLAERDSTDAREGEPAGPADAPAERTAVP